MISFLHYQDISVPTDRQRKFHDLGGHQELISSIQTVGLLNPIIIRAGRTLVAGERRLRAISDIYAIGGSICFAGVAVPLDHVPVLDVHDIDEIAAFESELDENIKRLDLSWQERVRSIADLAHLKSLKAKRDNLPPPSYHDIATELYETPTVVESKNVREDLILARHLDNPTIAKAKTAREAFTLLRKERQREDHERYGARLKEGVETINHKLYNVDCTVWLDSQPPEQFNVIITDPPYGMNAQDFGNAGKEIAYTTHEYSDSPEALNHIIDVMPGHLFRLAKPDAHLYLFCDFDRFHEWKGALDSAGWKVFRTPLIWFKPTAYRTPWVNLGPQRKYECILYAIKGTLFTQRLVGDVIESPSDENLGHSAQKPVALYKDLLSRSVQSGDTVFDPFCGSGTVFEAANLLQCRAVGCEIDTGYYGLAAQRIEGLKNVPNDSSKS